MPLIKCHICNKNFYAKPSQLKLGWGKFCSIRCRNVSQLKGLIRQCDICGKSVYRSPAKLKHSKSGFIFCGKVCQTKWRNSIYIEEKHPNWRTGVTAYREILKRRGDNPICFFCHISDERLLTVHHINKDRFNNKEANLAWLCYNCHYLIHHNKEAEKQFLAKLLSSK
jgi:endogenous inhibitor of DNA gyrase (YacG/DUF329 family)